MNGRIAMLEGRSGVWFTYNDGTPTGMQFPSPSWSCFPVALDMNPLSGGHYVASMQGGGFTTWGAGMGLVFTAGGCPYDASVYQGVRFLARADQPLVMSTLFPTADTNPPSSGGTCQELTGHTCFDSYQMQIGLSTGWQKFNLDFKSLAQEGWGQPVVFNRGKLIGINFQISSGVGAFTIKVDDIAFY